MANPSDQAPPASPEVPVATIEHDNSQLEEFVEQNKNKLLAAIALFLIIIIGFVGFRFVQDSGASKAAGALTAAKTIEELETVVSDFPNSVVAGSAELLIAGRLAAQDKDDESYAKLEAFVNNRKEHPLYYQGLSDLGLKDHVKGDLAKAVERLKEASSASEAPEFVQQTALLRLGDALTAQGLGAMAEDNVEAAKARFAEAQIAFEDLESRAGENTAYQRSAKQRRERLPHLSIKPLTPEEGRAATKAREEAEAAAAAANQDNANASTPGEGLVPAELTPPPVDVPGEIDLSNIPPAELTPPDQATLPAEQEGEDGAAEDGAGTEGEN